MQCHHHEREFSRKRRLIHKNQSLSCVRSAYDLIVEGFKSFTARVCEEWIVIHKQNRLCG